MKTEIDNEIRIGFEELLNKNKEIQDVIDSIKLDEEMGKFFDKINTFENIKAILIFIFGNDHSFVKKFDQKIKKNQKELVHLVMITKINKDLRDSNYKFFDKFIRGGLEASELKSFSKNNMNGYNEIILKSIDVLIIKKIADVELMIKKGRFRLASMKDVEKNLDNLRTEYTESSNLVYPNKKTKYIGFIKNLNEYEDDGTRCIADALWLRRFTVTAVVLAFIGLLIFLWPFLVDLYKWILQIIAKQ